LKEKTAVRSISFKPQEFIMLKRGNIFTNLPDASHKEVIEVISRMPGKDVHIERIVSDGQATPPKCWYNQAGHEWVVVLQGGAELEFDAPPAEERLAAGDWILIPANRRHRVRSTQLGTLWLAVHGEAPTGHSGHS
jgi:cupin 2 domain-containing protein